LLFYCYINDVLLSDYSKILHQLRICQVLWIIQDRQVRVDL